MKMIKRILTFTVITLIFFLIGYFTNKAILNSNDLIISFSLLRAYAFNAISCLALYTLIEIVSHYLPNETGYLYLGLIMVKLGLFILIFQDVIFTENGMSKPEKTSILVSVILFLGVETIGVSKLLNNK